jgi:hypothetical protein
MDAQEKLPKSETIRLRKRHVGWVITILSVVGAGRRYCQVFFQQEEPVFRGRQSVVKLFKTIFTYCPRVLELEEYFEFLLAIFMFPSRLRIRFVFFKTRGRGGDVWFRPLPHDTRAAGDAESLRWQGYDFDNWGTTSGAALHAFVINSSRDRSRIYSIGLRRITEQVCKVVYHRVSIRGGLISLWLYEENKLRDWKNVFTYSPLSSTHLWLRCSNFFNTSKKNSFGCAANRKSQRLVSAPTCTRQVW